MCGQGTRSYFHVEQAKFWHWPWTTMSEDLHQKQIYRKHNKTAADSNRDLLPGKFKRTQLDCSVTTFISLVPQGVGHHSTQKKGQTARHALHPRERGLWGPPNNREPKVRVCQVLVRFRQKQASKFFQLRVARHWKYPVYHTIAFVHRQPRLAHEVPDSIGVNLTNRYLLHEPSRVLTEVIVPYSDVRELSESFRSRHEKGVSASASQCHSPTVLEKIWMTFTTFSCYCHGNVGSCTSMSAHTSADDDLVGMSVSCPVAWAYS